MNPIFKPFLNEAVIPDEHNGLPVRRIGKEAFAGAKKLRSITLPKSITHIGYAAFWNCDALKTVHISDLAAWCAVKLEVSSSNPLCIGGDIFIGGELITELEIPDDVKGISDSAFYGCVSIKRVHVGGNVKSIGEGAFDGCGGLDRINLPSNTTNIGKYAFYGCDKLTYVNFGGTEADWSAVLVEGNKAFPSEVTYCYFDVKYHEKDVN